MEKKNQKQTKQKEKKFKIPSEITRFLYIKNLPSKITPEELYDIFTRFGPVRQIRRGVKNQNKGSAFVVYEELLDAKKAFEKLSGINVLGKYLICYYFNPRKDRGLHERTE